jgi:hypothetical protein
MTEFKVFVSRIPDKWTEKLMMEHFCALGFGEVASVELFTTKKKGRDEFTRRGAGNICFAFKNTGHCDRGDSCVFSHSVESAPSSESLPHIGCGLVYFTTIEGMNAALAQGTLHVSHRTVKISASYEPDERADITICYSWSKGQCTRGDQCRFSHDGPGGCMKVGTPFQGRKFHCLSFKTKGKCSKGDKCEFLHVESDKNIVSAVKQVKAPVESADGSVKGVCFTFKKKGKCRKV